MSFPLPSASGFVPSAAHHADGTDSDPVPSGRRRTSLAKLDFSALPDPTPAIITRETVEYWHERAMSLRLRLETHIAQHEPTLTPHLTARFHRCKELENSIFEARNGPFKSRFETTEDVRARNDFNQIKANLGAICGILRDHPVADALILFRDMAQGVDEASAVTRHLSRRGDDPSTRNHLTTINGLILKMDRAATLDDGRRSLAQLRTYLEPLTYSSSGVLPALARFPLPRSRQGGMPL
ncbi:hypothetical protein [Roseateles depolymerans]|uniref:Uncharacterized protein n=1 Tax=Roseateles depolymerans TaxID=76731 RepID=A0A0U3LRB4_9BURK|nr:hypothetical protein [Roseateles depolymerans]ALV08978.1 hypothetical protein RD2015_4537 [Roseateles depolymerans]REG10061.1 hypothetical protein DES44_4707 [Roseateles depolymerans]